MSKSQVLKTVAIFGLMFLSFASLVQALTYQQIVAGQQGRVLGASTPAFVQAASNAAYSGTTVAAAFGSNITAGDLIIAASTSGPSGNALSSFTATCVTGNLTEVAVDTTAYHTYMAYGIAGSNGPCSVTATYSGSGAQSIIIHEVSGIAASSPLDVSSVNFSAYGSTASPSSGSAVTASSGDYIFGYEFNNNGVNMSSPGAGFTFRSNVLGVGAIDTEDQIQASAGSIAATFNMISNAGNFDVGMMAFKPASGSGGGSQPPPDTTPPSVPTNLSASPMSSSQINLSWTASTDNVGVTGYTIYRGGTQIGTSASNSYSDTGLSASTQYTYTVSAYDAAGNNSRQSTSASATTQAQQQSGTYPWSNILSPSRAINWSNAGLPATLPDGETTPNPWTPPTRPACTSAQAGITVPIPSTASVASINSALANCAAANTKGSYLLLGPGTFNINSNVNLYGFNNVTLRGSGPMQTTLTISSGSWITIGSSSGAGSGLLTSGSNYAAGSNSVTIGPISGLIPKVGQVASVSQCDTGSGGQPCSTGPSDNGSIFVCGDYNPCQIGQDSDPVYSHESQTVLITSVTSLGGGTYTIGFSSPLYMPNWSFGSGAMLSWQDPTYDPVGIGLEDLTVYSPTTSSYNYLIQIAHSYASWLKGLRILGKGASFSLKVNDSKNFLIANNYCASQITLSVYGGCYSVDTSSDSLVLNNIAANGIPTEYDGGDTDVVTAYNFGRDAFTPYAFNLWSFDHHAFSSFYLYEGNESGRMSEDNTWGTHALNTYFRNYISGVDAPYVGGSINAQALIISNYHRFENVIGNVIGSSQITTYQAGTGNNVAFQIYTGDPLTASTLMRWGNVTNIPQLSDTPPSSGVRFVPGEVPSSLPSPNAVFTNPVPATTTLPPSFFLPVSSAHPNGGTGLSWWKVCTTWTTFPTACATTQTQPFPTTGPDVTGGSYVSGHSYDIPAAIAWANLPVDPTYQNSYAITSSSWANGTETLTISGLPSYSCGDGIPCDLLGAFQLSGVNAACMSGATFGNNAEILMTNSSNTTISYALASNPGTCGGGTFKFPDIRQFDEAVYQTDSSGGGSDTTPPAPPTGVSVQ